MLYDTSIYVNRNVHDLLGSLPGEFDFSEDRDEEYVTYSAVCKNGTELSFGFCAETISASERSWTLLMTNDPSDLDFTAKILAMYNVDPSEVDCARKWSGEPLADIDDLRQRLVLARAVLDDAQSSGSSHQRLQNSTAGSNANNSSDGTVGGVPAQKKFLIVDAEGVVVKRVASLVAQHLSGQRKRAYASGADVSDSVIVVNADKVLVTGSKYFGRHLGVFGPRHVVGTGLIDKDIFERVIVSAVENLIPPTRVGKKKLENLKVYTGFPVALEAFRSDVSVSKKASGGLKGKVFIVGGRRFDGSADGNVSAVGKRSQNRSAGKHK